MHSRLLIKRWNPFVFSSVIRVPASQAGLFLAKMSFKILVLLAVIGLVYSEIDESNREGRFLNYKKKSYGELYKKLEKSDLEETKRSEEFAGEALNGMYTECLAQISFSCVQKKVLNFINRMNRMEKFSVLGNYVSIVRTKNDYEQEPEFEARLNTAEQQSNLDDLMETSIDRFLDSHIFRIRVPNSFSVIKPADNSRSFEPSTSLDFRFPFTGGNEARKKGGGGKMGKKMMMMMMMGLKAKFMMLGPLILGLAGLMAIKALLASVISLTISKIMILKKLMKNKGGGGHGGGGWDSSGHGGGGGGGGWSLGGGGGGGGGGWDRRSIYEKQPESSWDASDLAYRAYSTVENLF